MTFPQFASGIVIIAASALTWYGVVLIIEVLVTGRLSYHLYRRVS